MDKQEQLKFFNTFKEENIDFGILLENIFLEFIQEKENEKLYPNYWYIKVLIYFDKNFFWTLYNKLKLIKYSLADDC